MIDQNCLVCFGLCWVCENDPIRRDEKLGGPECPLSVNEPTGSNNPTSITS
jgi:hypothetical protein